MLRRERTLGRLPLIAALALACCVPVAPRRAQQPQQQPQLQQSSRAQPVLPAPGARPVGPALPLLPGPAPPPAAAGTSQAPRPDQPVGTPLVTSLGGIVATINGWTLVYEGILSDGRLRFLERVSENQTKDVVYDPWRSGAYPFANYSIDILGFTPSNLSFRIEPAD